MTTNESSATLITLPSDREITVTRTFDAPRELVWKMWTDPEHIKAWWSPSPWTLPYCEVDLRVGGEWRYCMRGPNGEDACGMAIYREIVEPERLAFTDLFTDSDGNPVEGMPESIVTVEFSERDGLTTIVSSTLYQSQEDRDRVIEMGINEGISQALDQMADELARLQGL